MEQTEKEALNYNANLMLLPSTKLDCKNIVNIHCAFIV